MTECLDLCVSFPSFTSVINISLRRQGDAKEGLLARFEMCWNVGCEWSGLYKRSHTANWRTSWSVSFNELKQEAGRIQLECSVRRGKFIRTANAFKDSLYNLHAVFTVAMQNTNQWNVHGKAKCSQPTVVCIESLILVQRHTALKSHSINFKQSKTSPTQ